MGNFKILALGRLLLLCIMGIVSLTGCTALVAGGAAVTAGTGTYLYMNGELRTDYLATFDKLWNACERMMADMQATNVIPAKDISKGAIDAVIDGEKVRLIVSYKTKNVTSLSIRVGLVGDRMASQRLHDKIQEYLSQK